MSLDLEGNAENWAYRIAMVVPLSGPGGIFGPSCIAVSDLAAGELNAGDGIGSRPVELVYVDGGAAPAQVAFEVQQLLNLGMIDAVTGWHISSVRQAMVRILDRRIPYVYTSLYEGGENAAGVYCSGETPAQQILPGMKWMRDELGVRSWTVVGANYAWPRESFQQIELFAARLNVRIVESHFVQMGHTDMGQLARRTALSRCDGVLMMFVGQDAVDFNREFAGLGLHQHVVRFSPLMDENMLLAGGEHSGENLYAAASYFRSLPTAESLELVDSYVRQNGVAGPALNNMAQSCSQGIYTLASLAKASPTLSVSDFDAAIDGTAFSSPRGEVRFENNQAIQKVHLARAEGFDFDVLHTF